MFACILLVYASILKCALHVYLIYLNIVAPGTATETEAKDREIAQIGQSVMDHADTGRVGKSCPQCPSWACLCPLLMAAPSQMRQWLKMACNMLCRRLPLSAVSLTVMRWWPCCATCVALHLVRWVQYHSSCALKRLQHHFTQACGQMQSCGHQAVT